MFSGDVEHRSSAVEHVLNIDEVGAAALNRFSKSRTSVHSRSVASVISGVFFTAVEFVLLAISLGEFVVSICSEDGLEGSQPNRVVEFNISLIVLVSSRWCLFALPDRVENGWVFFLFKLEDFVDMVRFGEGPTSSLGGVRGHENERK